MRLLAEAIATPVAVEVQALSQGHGECESLPGDLVLP